MNFFLQNSYHIRDLDLNLTHFEMFVNSNCTRLSRLTLGFAYEDGEESDDDENPSDTITRGIMMDSLDTTESSSSTTTEITTMTTNTNKPACAVQLIHSNPGLRTLRIVDGGRRGNQPLRPLAGSILHAIANHTFLTRIDLTLKLTCLMLGKILNHLPRQLQHLDIVFDVSDVRHHKRCDHQTRFFKSHAKRLALRRLLLQGVMPCFFERMFVLFLQQCPDLEEITLPITDGEQDFRQVAQTLNSHCPRLHTLDQELFNPRTIAAKHVGFLLQTFSRGFQQLRLDVRCHVNNYFPGWQENMILKTLVTTASVNTVEFLRIRSYEDNGSHVIGVLKHCSRLREFRVTHGYVYGDNKGVDMTDLLQSMDEPWKCWETLEVLELTVVNQRAVRDQSYPKARRRKTAHDARQLCIRLRSIPKLAVADIYWLLMTSWEGTRGRDMDLTLDNLNEGAARSGAMMITSEEMKWVGLS